jgi:hypothetical protein
MLLLLLLREKEVLPEPISSSFVTVLFKHFTSKETLLYLWSHSLYTQDILTEVFDLRDRQGLSFNTFFSPLTKLDWLTSADAEYSSPVVALVYVTGEKPQGVTRLAGQRPLSSRLDKKHA